MGNPELAYEHKLRNTPILAWEGQVLPDFSSAVDLDGKPISLADYRGKAVLFIADYADYTDSHRFFMGYYSTPSNAIRAFDVDSLRHI